jgi:predicted RNA-binding protein with PIN domain
MALLIDGYNLLHASGILGRGIGPGGLERSRTALLNFLVESLSERDLGGAVVVFDARDAPPGLPRLTSHRGLAVRFAEPGSDADQVIEDLIRADTSPRRLVVVSSDHRLHRAAKRRGAQPIDSDRWYAEVLRQRIARQRGTRPVNKPSDPSTTGEVDYWLRQFGMEETEKDDDKSASSDPPERAPDSPFPPGYGEDLEEQ